MQTRRTVCQRRALNSPFRIKLSWVSCSVSFVGPKKQKKLSRYLKSLWTVCPTKRREICFSLFIYQLFWSLSNLKHFKDLTAITKLEFCYNVVSSHTFSNVVLHDNWIFLGHNKLKLVIRLHSCMNVLMTSDICEVNINNSHPDIEYFILKFPDIDFRVVALLC